MAELAVVVSVWVLVVGGGCAWATTGHTFAGQFGGPGDGDGQFGEPLANKGPAGIAVMASTGEVFTADTGQGAQSAQPRVQRFSADGEFQSAFPVDPTNFGDFTSIAVDPAGSGAVYVSSGFNGGSIFVRKFSAAGVFAYDLDFVGSGVVQGGGARVAVDPVNGTVYVTGTRESDGAQVIASFGQTTGAFITAFDGSNGSSDGGFGGCRPTGLAVDGSHRVYVLDPCKNRVDRFSAGGVFDASLDLQLAPRADGSAETLSAVAADPVSDEVYVAHSGPVGVRVTHLGAGGAGVVYAFDAREAAAVRPGAMAVSGAGQVYLSDLTRAFVVRYSRFAGPTVVTGEAPPASIEATSAVLEGTIDPEGVASTYHFEYSTDLSFGSRTPEAGAGNGNGAESESVTVPDLRPNTNYNFRIVGTNASGSIFGATVAFTTGPAPPEVDGTSPPGSSPAFASAISPRSARLHGTVNPNNNTLVGHYVEFGPTTAYGRAVGAVNDAGLQASFGGGDDVPVIASVTGLEPGTTYHFRVVAGVGFTIPSLDPQVGADQTFVTAPAAGGGATGVTTKRARLTGTIDPHGVATSYHFNYGPTASYGTSTPEVAAGSGDGERQVSQDISGLLADTTYHVQVVATSPGGVVRSGADGLFRTAPAPTAMVIGPTGVSTDAATLAGEVNTYGLTGSYHFDVWSLDSNYAVSTPTRAVSGSARAERVGAVLGGLPAGETFVVQLSVDSNDSTNVSDMLTFATAPVPKVFPGSPTANPYGCGAPRLDAYSRKPKTGETIAITGQDLGVGGSVMLGDRLLEPVGWSEGGFRVVVPDEVSGTLALTVNCGRGSNSIAVTVFAEPDNGFSITDQSVAGSTASLRVRVPGPGKIESSGIHTQAVKVSVKKATTATVKVKLTSAGRRVVARSKSHTLKVRVRVRFTPAGGRAAGKTVMVTFKRGGGR